MAAVAHPGRPQIRRNSPLSIHNGLHGFSADAPMLQRIDIDDSDSDDEPPPAIKFSKVTQALLDDAPVPSSPPRQEQRIEYSHSNRSLNSSRAGVDTPSRAPGIKIIRRSSPALANEGSRGNTPPRIVQIGAKGSNSAAKRSISISGPYPYRFPAKREPTPSHDDRPEVITPAPAPRALRVRTRANSATSQDGNGHSSSRPGSRNGVRSAVDSENESHPADLGRSTSTHHGAETISRFGTSSITRTRNPSAETGLPPGTQRVKRAPLAGSLLKNGPVRRGFRRRDSEDNVSPNDDVQSGLGSGPQDVARSASQYVQQGSSASKAPGSQNRHDSASAGATSVEPVSTHDFANKSHLSHESRSGSRQGSSNQIRSRLNDDDLPQPQSNDRIRRRALSPEQVQHRLQPSVHQDDVPARSHLPDRQPVEEQLQPGPAVEQKPPQRAPSLRGAQFRYVAPARKIQTDASEDQENMPPPTFKRNKDQEFKHLGKPAISILADSDQPKSRHVDETPVPVQQEQRKALGTISGNTPHRAAPAPPPKMSIIETATTTAGASVTKTKKKRSHIIINGKVFTSMGKIASGGSSTVHNVMAENYRIFALKKVRLDNADESAVRGYKGEIDLLRKLEEVERVVRLFDFEINEEKQELSLLMEKGDVDFGRLLSLRASSDHARFDPVFTRYHWREMLECVQSVHDKEIVHSDLKPANFIFVQGRLKLIDFGIANAIDTDNTVNVHRDTHVGTPNYMSPESITDTNAPQPGDIPSRDAAEAAGKQQPVKKDMRIGKASDVWSLGCILYQMSYGRPPFAHIANQLSRIMAITNPNHTITFPAHGVGGAFIPPSLRGCLRRCLNRDPERRPTVQQLLSDEDAYMNPEREGVVVLDEGFLGQIIGKVVERCRDPKRGVPGEGEVRGYAGSFMERIWDMQEKGGG